MHVIDARNVNDAFYLGTRLLRDRSRLSDSRNGLVLELDQPVSTLYAHPEECVLFNAKRDANPFFHLMEALWMLSGSNEVAWLTQFLPRMADYSDDGRIFHGAYGWRWREHFAFDQLDTAVQQLKEDPSTRRAVIAMHDPRTDAAYDGKDQPCNTHIYLSMRRGRLDMMVSCRSNDIIYGLYGANVVHFSLLMQYLAARIGAPLGRYHHVSFNFHAYRDVWLNTVEPFLVDDPYQGYVSSFRLVHYSEAFDADLQHFMVGGRSFRNPFFNRVAVPMRDSYLEWREGRKTEALARLGEYSSSIDWIAAGLNWMERRL